MTNSKCFVWPQIESYRPKRCSTIHESRLKQLLWMCMHSFTAIINCVHDLKRHSCTSSSQTHTVAIKDCFARKITLMNGWMSGFSWNIVRVISWPLRRTEYVFCAKAQTQGHNQCQGQNLLIGQIFVTSGIDSRVDSRLTEEMKTFGL